MELNKPRKMDESHPIDDTEIDKDSAHNNESIAEAKTTNETHQMLVDAHIEHDLAILKTADAARDRSNYLDYDYHTANGDPNIKLFMARRIGRGHIEANKPCQDFCRTAEVGAYSILTDADGVSACPYSDVGSQLACEAAIAVITEVIKTYQASEADVINTLTSLLFKERLVLKWVDLVKHKIKESKDEPENLAEEIKKYGSTIMFAVISPNWYVCGNLGDGQIMVFNDKYGIKLRDVKKESSSVRCLVHSTCAREDIIVEAFSRSWFNGILLSTDGMYDFLSNGFEFYRYACQIKARFTMFSDQPEPLQPFCYMKPNEPLKDISRHPRATDDCSIVLAIDDKTIESDCYDEFESLKHGTEIILPSRWSSLCRQYLVYENGIDYEVCVVNGKREFELPHLQSAVVEKPIKTTTRKSKDSNGIEKTSYFSFYPLESIDTHTLEYLFIHGKLLQIYSALPDSINILDLYTQYKNLKKELKSHGLMLNGASHFLITFKNDKLYVKPEAISIARKQEPVTIADSYFSALIGALICGEKRIALYDSGFLTEGRVIKEIELNETAEKKKLIGRVRNMDRHKAKPYTLINYSDSIWTLSDGSVVKRTEGTILKSGMAFCIGKQFDEQGVVYRFMPKEEL